MSRQGENRLQKQPLSLLLVILLAWGVAACGGSKKQTAPGEGDDINIDQLLGIDGDVEGGQQAVADTPPADKSKDEDEVLRLLGITTDEQTEEKPADQIAAQEPGASPFQDEVNRLQTELFEKENIIEELRKELNEKNERLTALQTSGLNNRPAPQTTTQPAPVSARAGESLNDRYNQALAAYNAGRYKEAVSRFSALLSESVPASLADNCQYWIGESYFGMGNFVQALVEFEKVSQYANSNKADAAKLKLGITHLRLNDKAAARREFQGLLDNYPKSDYVGRAQQYLANL